VSLWRRVYQERRALVLPVMVFVLANVAVLGLVVLPLMQNVSTLEANAETASNELLRARLLDKQAKDTLGSKERADQELKKFYVDILPKSESGARRVVAFLNRTAEENGVRFNRNSQDHQEIKESQLVRASSSFTMTGTYANIRKFLYAVETAEEFVVIERVGLAQAAELRSAASTGNLEVDLDVATYYLVDTPATQ
jgi:Tfp pilus assembly protein PilO